jgi:hypothetical protein
MKGMFGSELSVNERPSLDRQQSSFSWSGFQPTA